MICETENHKLSFFFKQENNKAHEFVMIEQSLKYADTKTFLKSQKVVFVRENIL